MLSLNSYAQDLQYAPCNGCDQGYTTSEPLNTLQTYQAPRAYTAGHLESDFDMRRAGGNTRWHKGLDLRNHGAGADMQRGDAIISHEAGTIEDIQESGYKYIIIDGATNDFGYGHIFSHHDVTPTSMWKSGKFVLKMSEPVNNMREPCIIDLEDCIAYCEEANLQVVIANNPHCADTLTTTNQVAAGAAIAPVGGSRGGTSGTDFPVHVHLYKFRDPTAGINNANCMDPLVDLTHPHTDYTYNFCFNQNIEAVNFNNWGLRTLLYGPTQRNTISIRTSMDGAMQGLDRSRYTNVVQNLDSIMFYQKKVCEQDYEPIVGSRDTSKFLLHAQRNTPLYPSTLPTTYGNVNTTGMSPYAYRDGVAFGPHDNFYYADFYSRIHTSDIPGDNTTQLAYCNEQARYPDGQYEFLGVVTDVRNNRDSSAVDTVVLDNYKPYINGLSVYLGTVSDDYQLYQMGWECGSSQCTNNGIYPNGGLQYPDDLTLDDLCADLIVHAATSEPMRDLSIEIEVSGANQTALITAQLNPTNCERTQWEGTIDHGQQLWSGHQYDLNFEGHDFSELVQGGNELPIRGRGLHLFPFL